MMRFTLPLLLLMAAPVAAQTIRQQTDSLRAETCRGGTLRANGTCVGRKQAPRTTVIYRLANRIDSLAGGVAPAPVPEPIPGPTPPPDPVALPTPTTVAPGTTSLPATFVANLTPTFSWSPVTGATGYVLAIRNTVTGALVYPSTTGVGTPIPGISLTLPAGVLVYDGEYTWDVTAVNATSKSLPSANRYFWTPDPPPAPTPIPEPTPEPTPPPTGSSVAELPRVFLSFPYPTPTRVVQVTATGLASNLQAALDAAQRGDELVLAAGATWTGNYRATSCGSGWITLRGSAVTVGTRASPNAAYPKLITANNEAPLTVTGCRWRLVGIEATVATSVSATVYGIVRLEGVDNVLSGSYVHGQATSQIARCVTMNGARQEVSDSYLSDCHGSGFDSQAIWGGNGPGPFRIVNNYLEGAGENLMFGGNDPVQVGLVPSDIEIRRNHFRKPVTWKGTGWQIKNLLELKNAVRVLVEGNVLEGSWPGEQGGVAVTIMSTNQEGGCRWCRVMDVTFRQNLIRHAGQGINIAKSRYFPLDSTTRRIHIVDNVLDSLGYTPWANDGDDRRALQSLSGVEAVTIERTLVTGARLKSPLSVEGGSPFKLIDNAWVSGEYGIIGSGYGGASALQHYVPGYVWTGHIWLTGAEPAQAAAIRAAVNAATAGVVVTP